MHICFPKIERCAPAMWQRECHSCTSEDLNFHLAWLPSDHLISDLHLPIYKIMVLNCMVSKPSSSEKRYGSFPGIVKLSWYSLRDRCLMLPQFRSWPPRDLTELTGMIHLGESSPRCLQGRTAPASVLPLVKIAVTQQLKDSRHSPQSDQLDDIVQSSEGKGGVRRRTEASSPLTSEILSRAVLEGDLILSAETPFKDLPGLPGGSHLADSLGVRSPQSENETASYQREEDFLAKGNLRQTPSGGCARITNPVAYTGTSGLSPYLFRNPHREFPSDRVALSSVG